MRWPIKTMEYLVNFLFFEGKKALTVEQKFILTKFGPVALRRSVMAAALWSKTFWFFKMISAPCIARLDVVAIMPSFVESCTPKIWLHCLELEVVSVLLQLVFNQFCLVNTKYIMIRSIYVETIDNWSFFSCQFNDMKFKTFWWKRQPTYRYKSADQFSQSGPVVHSTTNGKRLILCNNQ